MQDVYESMTIAIMGKAIRQLPARDAYVLSAVYGLDDGIPKTQVQVCPSCHTRIFIT